MEGCNRCDYVPFWLPRYTVQLENKSPKRRLDSVQALGRHLRLSYCEILKVDTNDGEHRELLADRWFPTAVVPQLSIAYRRPEEPILGEFGAVFCQTVVVALDIVKMWLPNELTLTRAGMAWKLLQQIAETGITNFAFTDDYDDRVSTSTLLEFCFASAADGCSRHISAKNNFGWRLGPGSTFSPTRPNPEIFGSTI